MNGRPADTARTPCRRIPARHGVVSLLVAVAAIGTSTLVLSDALLLWR